MAKKKKELEGEVYYPSEEILKSARVKDYECLYSQSIEDREGFWEKEAGKLHWYKKWDKILDDSKKPFYKWFTGGRGHAQVPDHHVICRGEKDRRGVLYGAGQGFLVA